MRQLVITTFIPILICINSVNAQNIIRIHEKSNDKIAYSQIFQSAKLVKLETSPECVIGGIGTLKVDGDHLFAYDNRQETLFVFTIDGHFIAKIGTKGKGPGEMVNPAGFTLNRSKKQIEILDTGTKRILVFDYSGKYIKTNRSVWVRGFEKLSETNYIGYSYNGPFYSDDYAIGPMVLGIFNSQGRILKVFEGIRTIPGSISVVTHSNLFLSKDRNAYVVPIFQHGLFRIDTALNLVKVCDFVFDTKIPADHLLESTDFEAAVRDNSKKGYPGLISGIKVVNENLSFCYDYNRDMYCAFGKLSSNNTISVKRTNFLNDLALFETRFFVGSWDEGLIDIIEALDFKEEYKKVIQADKNLSIIKQPGIKDSILDLVKATNENDNPILIFYEYK